MEQKYDAMEQKIIHKALCLQITKTVAILLRISR